MSKAADHPARVLEALRQGRRLMKPWAKNDRITTQELIKLLDKADRTCEVNVNGEPVVAVEFVESPHGTIVMLRSKTEGMGGTQDNAD